MKAKRENLVAAAAALERARAGADAGVDPNGRLARTLDVVAQAVRRHAEHLQTPEGGVVDVDSPRVPSPWLDRRVEHLHDELNALLQEVGTLRAQLRWHAADLDPILSRAGVVAEALRRYDEDEAELIQESINTEVGAGD
jgi:hypothetical protein